MKRGLAIFLIRLVPGLMMLAVVSSILAGVSTIGLFAFVFLAIRGNAPGEIHAPLIFAGLAVAFIASRSFAAFAMARVGRAVTAKLRKALISELLRTPYCRLEAIGTLRLSTAVTTDIQTIAGAVPALVSAATNFGMVASLLIYMSWLSSVGVVVILGAAAIGMPIYWSLMGRAARLSYEAGSLWEHLSANLNGLVSGIKQLRLNSDRTSHYLSDDIGLAQAAFLKCRTRATFANTLATNAAQVIFLSTLGYLLFVRPHDGLGVSVEFFFAAIYLMGPLDGVVGSVGAFVQISAVFARHQELGLRLSPVISGYEAPEPAVTVPAWHQIRFDQVSYSYGEATGFSFGPVDLALRRGEIVFVKGGNGSGKSTFVKLLTGVYEPATGSVLVDDRPIGDANLQAYRELFSCIFDDAYMFESVWVPERRASRENDARALLDAWSLSSRVDVRDFRFTNTRALSRGQRGRLLLISAALEDRDVCIFDEWAADQDSPSRRKFYLEFLPALKRSGKLVVVLTHDEEFDGIADQIIKFQDGRVVAGPQGAEPREYLLVSGHQ